MKLEEIQDYVTEFVKANPGKPTNFILTHLREKEFPVPVWIIVDKWRKDAGGKVEQPKGQITLELYPEDLPSHFAASLKRSWRIKRGRRNPETGYEIYNIQKWEAGERVMNIHFRTRFFADFLNKFQDVADANLKIVQVIEGKKERLDTTTRDPRKDGVIIGNTSPRRSGQRVNQETRNQMVKMFQDMSGFHRTRYRRIARSIGNVAPETVARIVKNELDKQRKAA